MRHILHLATLTMLLAASPRVAWALPEDSGTLTPEHESRALPLDGATVELDLYWPEETSGAPYPLVVIAHGWARSKANFAQWGEELARRGYVAVAPNFPNAFTPDHARNGRIVSQLLDAVASAGKAPGDRLFGLVDGSRRGVVGHSAGALAGLLAAADDDRIDALVALDLTDANDLGVAAAPNVGCPTLYLLAEPGACNGQGNALGSYDALLGPKMRLKVVGAVHCDAEAPSDLLCAVGCGGGWDQARHTSFRRYAFALLDYRLRCQLDDAAWLGGSLAQQDGAISALDAQGFPPEPLGCQEAPDAGVPQDAGGTSDAAALADAGVANDAASSDSSAGDARPATGGAGGCAIVERVTAFPPWALLALLLLHGVRRRSPR